ncbi:hypothetical protein [Aliikangiella sp. G2MR2-5]|uniref:hypothetical protein n=1 Tax=Aliikangiella sp. G2MR2-5 TaxID=2788943 RepID=UPI0018AAEDBA|nr:hypothetical protein [Aliikangiella sp. G2MR2-5]
MSDQVFSWLIVLEAVLPFLTLSIVLIIIMVRARKKNKEAVRSLILRVKNGEESQKAMLLSFLTQKLGIEETAAKKQSKKMINERKFLVRNLISVLLDKNMEAVVGLEDDLNRIAKMYHDLEVQVPSSDTAEVEIHEEEIDIDELKSEIKSLKHEVHVTLTTLNNIFAEFSSMFGEEVPETEMSVDQIITAMESFSGKSASEDFSADPEEEDELDGFDAFAESAADILEETEEAVEDDLVMEEIDVDSFEEDEAEVEDEPVEDFEEDSEMEADSESKSEAGESELDETETASSTDTKDDDELDFSIDSELDDIDSALDELELGISEDIEDDEEDEEPSWDDAFAESGDEKPHDI